jgi:hypothetical protein
MEKSLISELNRINELIGSKRIINESATEPPWLLKLIGVEDDILVQSAKRATSSEIRQLESDIAALRNATTEAEEITLTKSILSRVEKTTLAEKLVEKKLLGANTSKAADTLTRHIEDGSMTFADAEEKMNRILDAPGAIEDVELKNSLKFEYRKKFSEANKKNMRVVQQKETDAINNLSDARRIYNEIKFKNKLLIEKDATLKTYFEEAQQRIKLLKESDFQFLDSLSQVEVNGMLAKLQQLEPTLYTKIQKLGIGTFIKKNATTVLICTLLPASVVWGVFNFVFKRGSQHYKEAEKFLNNTYGDDSGKKEDDETNNSGGGKKCPDGSEPTSTDFENGVMKGYCNGKWEILK